MRTTTRVFRLGAALAASFIVLSGCAPARPAPEPTRAPAPPATSAPTAAPKPADAPAKPTEAPKPAEVAKPATQPKRGGTMVVGTGNDPGQFNPGITTAGGTHLVTGNIYNGLLTLDEKFDPKPDLAESWTVTPDGKTYTFRLASGVTWHDGKPFSSADVKFTFDEILLKFHARTKAGLETVLDGIDAPDPGTVVMRFKQPYGPLLQRLDVVEAPILPKHVYEGSDPQQNPANQKPVGTGPFKLAEYRKGELARLTRNESYFKKGYPLLDELVFKIIPQANTATIAFEQGEVDYLWSVNGADVGRLKAMKDISIATTSAGSGGSNCQETLVFNLRKAPFDKLEVRQAFAHAIDRQQILEQVRFGLGRVAISPISSSLGWAHNPNVIKYPRDVARAASLLDQAGLKPDANKSRLKVTFTHATQYVKIGEVMRQNLAEVGVDLELKTLEVNAANEAVYIKQDFELGIASYCNGPDPEIGVTRAYVSSNIKPIPFANGAAYANPRVDELFNQAASAVDRGQRTKLYGEIQDIIVKDLPYWWLVETDQVRAIKNEYHDLFIWSGNLAERTWWEKAK
ncbi:MAG: ABC transporter substrate-binding protein [Chloroflexota bacterium]